MGDSLLEVSKTVFICLGQIIVSIVTKLFLQFDLHRFCRARCKQDADI